MTEFPVDILHENIGKGASEFLINLSKQRYGRVIKTSRAWRAKIFQNLSTRI